MIERVIENWLTKVGERGFETAFAQLLTAEGFTVLHEPVHHPFEHGKDIRAVGPDGATWAFQLKGDAHDLKDISDILPQLFALQSSTFDYPGFPVKQPDKTALVVTGALTTPARDRIRSFESANRDRKLPPMELVEREQLVARFSAAHSRYLPNAIVNLRKLLTLYLGDGRGSLPVNALIEIMRDALGTDADRTASECTKAAASCGVIVSVATAPWMDAQNQVAVAEAWLAYTFQCLRLVEFCKVGDEAVEESINIALSIVSEAANALLIDAETEGDLVIPDIVDGMAYSIRVLSVCGLLAAAALAEMVPLSRVADVIKRELPFAKIVGEAGIPPLLIMATALNKSGDLLAAGKIVFQLAWELSHTNQPDSPTALADPYHSSEEELSRQIGLDTTVSNERFDGQAYTLHILLDWLIRRDLRAVTEKIYPEATKVACNELQVSEPFRLFDTEDSNSHLRMWELPRPGSWAKLSESAKRLREKDIPEVLWRHADIMAFLPLVLPHRMTTSVAKAIDYWYLSLVSLEEAETN